MAAEMEGYGYIDIRKDSIEKSLFRIAAALEDLVGLAHTATIYLRQPMAKVTMKPIPESYLDEE